MNPFRDRKGRRLPPAIETALLINVVPFLWGSYGPAAKLLTNQDPVIPLPLLNFLTTGVSLLSLNAAISYQRNERPSQQKDAPFAVVAELGAYLFLGSFIHLRSVAFTTASRSSFFVQLTTAFVPLLELLFGKAVSPVVIPACLLTVFGAACLALPADLNLLTSASSLFSSVNKGDLLAILSAVFYR